MKKIHTEKFDQIGILLIDPEKIKIRKVKGQDAYEISWPGIVQLSTPLLGAKMEITSKTWPKSGISFKGKKKK